MREAGGESDEAISSASLLAAFLAFPVCRGVGIATSEIPEVSIVAGQTPSCVRIYKPSRSS